MLFALLISAISVFGQFSVPQLSHQSVVQLVRRYLQQFPPEVLLLGHARASTRLDGALVASGLFSSFPVTGSCGEHLTYLQLTPRGNEIAFQRGWELDTQGWYGLRIPLGTFSLVTESLTYWKPYGLPGTIRFAYWFKGNANVPYLLSLAPASAWGSVGMYDGGSVMLDEANRLLIGTLTIMWGGNGWVIERYAPHQEHEIC